MILVIPTVLVENTEYPSIRFLKSETLVRMTFQYHCQEKLLGFSKTLPKFINLQRAVILANSLKNI